METASAAVATGTALATATGRATASGPATRTAPASSTTGLYNSGGIGARPGWYSQYAPLGYNPRDLSNNRVNGTNFYPGGLLNNGYVQPSTTYMTPGTTTYVVPSSGTMMQSGGMMISPAMVNPTGHYTVEAMEDGKYVVKGTYPDLAQAAQKQDELKAKNSKMETKIVKK